MQDTAICYIALHSLNEDDYDCATTHLYLKGKEAYDLMLKFIDEICVDDCIEADHRIYVEDENAYKNAMDLSAVKEDIKYQLEDSDAKLNRIFSDEKFAYWKQFLSKKVIKQYEK